MIDYILGFGLYTVPQLVLLIDLHQIITFLIEFIITAFVIHRLSRSSANPPKTYALMSIMAVAVFAANIPSFLIFLTLEFNITLFYLIIPVSIAIEYFFLLVMFIILGIIPEERRRAGAVFLLISVVVGNLLSYGAFLALTLLL